jgi:hypothetical protein
MKQRPDSGDPARVFDKQKESTGNDEDWSATARDLNSIDPPVIGDATSATRQRGVVRVHVTAWPRFPRNQTSARPETQPLRRRKGKRSGCPDRGSRPGPASMAPGITSTTALSTISMIAMDRVSEAKASPRAVRGATPARSSGNHRQKIAKQERQVPRRARMVLTWSPASIRSRRPCRRPSPIRTSRQISEGVAAERERRFKESRWVTSCALSICDSGRQLIRRPGSRRKAEHELAVALRHCYR